MRSISSTPRSRNEKLSRYIPSTSFAGSTDRRGPSGVETSLSSLGTLVQLEKGASWVLVRIQDCWRTRPSGAPK